MGKKDIGGKDLINRNPDGWVRWLLGDATLTVEAILTTDFQFISRQSDSLLQVRGPAGVFGVLSELQLAYDDGMPARIQNYVAMGRQKLGISIVPVVVYLTEPPDGTKIATAFHQEFMGLVTHQDFFVVKIWELDAQLADQLPITVLPFVPLMANTNENILYECVRRIRSESNHEELETTLALFALMRLDAEAVARIMRWSMTVLEKSPIYQQIIEKGENKALVRSIMRVLKRRFGDVPGTIQIQLEQTSVETLETLLDEVFELLDLAAFEARLADLLSA